MVATQTWLPRRHGCRADTWSPRRHGCRARFSLAVDALALAIDIGLDRGDVGVDQDNLQTLLLQRLDCLRARVVELTCVSTRLSIFCPSGFLDAE
eukprot:5435249-Prymnesium_polylepis.1